MRDLSKAYGPVRALDRVSFSVDEGQVLGFLGPNGAGKSTTLRILSGFLPGDSGTVRVAGHDVSSHSLAVRDSIGYLPEGVPLYPDLRVDEYLRFRARLKGVRRRDRRRLIDQALEKTQTTDMRRRMIHTLSRGFRQRVGLADALLSEPRVLILDEPTVGLDPEQVRQFRKLLRDVGRDRTVILSTHILSEVELVCSDVVIIAGGQIVARDTADGIAKSAGSRFSIVAEIAGSAASGTTGDHDAIVAALRGLDGAAEVDIVPPAASGGGAAEASGRWRRYRISSYREEITAEAVFALVKDRDWSLRHLEREVRSLEDVFLDIVGKKP